MTKRYVLLLHRNGETMIAKDYGDYAWDGPLLQVVAYFPRFREAQKAQTELRDDPSLLPVFLDRPA